MLNKWISAKNSIGGERVIINTEDISYIEEDDNEIRMWVQFRNGEKILIDSLEVLRDASKAD